MLPLLLLNNNDPVFAPYFLQPIFLDHFFQGYKPTHVFKTRIVGADWLGDLLVFPHICIFNFLSLWKEIKNFKNTIAVARIYEYFFSIYRWNRPIILSYWMLGYILAMSSQDLIKSPSPNFIMLALWTQVTFKSKRMHYG